MPPPVPHRVVDVETTHGRARCYVLDETSSRRGTLVLGHGAGKGTNTPDLAGAAAVCADGWRVVLVDQPWVVAGRRLATRPPTLDAAWTQVVEDLRARDELSGHLVLGGRSAGARVACRTAAALRADLVVALAFPLVPPGKNNDPAKWRTGEARTVLDAGIPLLVVQGEKDTFGGPDLLRQMLPAAQLVSVRGGHSFSAHPDDVGAAVREALRRLG